MTQEVLIENPAENARGPTLQERLQQLHETRVVSMLGVFGTSFILGSGVRWGVRNGFSFLGIGGWPLTIGVGAVTGGLLSLGSEYHLQRMMIQPIYQPPPDQREVPWAEYYAQQLRSGHRVDITTVQQNMDQNGNILVDTRESWIDRTRRNFKNEFYRMRMTRKKQLFAALGKGLGFGALGALVGGGLVEALHQIPWDQIRPSWWPLGGGATPDRPLDPETPPGQQPPETPPQQPPSGQQPPETPPTQPPPGQEQPPSGPGAPTDKITIPAGSNISNQLENVLRQELQRDPTAAELDFLVDEFLREHPTVDPRAVQPGTSFDISNLRDEIDRIKQGLAAPIPTETPPPTGQVPSTVILNPNSTLWQEVEEAYEAAENRQLSDAEILERSSKAAILSDVEVDIWKIDGRYEDTELQPGFKIRLR